MEIRTEMQDGVTLVQLSGEVDMSNSPTVRDVLMKLAGQKTSPIVVELSGVSYMDSSGIATLVEGLQETMSYGGQFRLASLTPKVKQVFDLARLVDVFEIYPSLDEAKEGR
ncbi:MAG: STAS domain-containing protein [bacterium]|nr:STAS domain-containing protein [bacterium]